MRVQYVGFDFTDSECREILSYFRRKTSPVQEVIGGTKRDVLPLTFKYNGAVVQYSIMSYLSKPIGQKQCSINDFRRALCLEIEAEKPTGIFHDIAAEFYALSCIMDGNTTCGYPFKDIPIRTIDAVIESVPELELVAK